MKPLVLFGLLFVLLTGCSIKTPEIQGVVLDEKTKQPVEGAWVTATLEIVTKTFNGDSTAYLSVDPPHTRTDRNGKFSIPARRFPKQLPPVVFGTTVTGFGVGASTIDDKGGSANLLQHLSEPSVGPTIYVKPDERTEAEYFAHLQALFNYCLTGRFAVERPAVKGGCDAWELGYVITKHVGFLKNLGEPKTAEQETRHKGTLYQLAYLYQQRGDYRKALDAFVRVRDFDKKRDVTMWLKEYEARIHELEQKIEAK